MLMLLGIISQPVVSREHAVRQSNAGRVLVIRGPCGKKGARPCCKPIIVRLPERIDVPFSSMVGLKVFFAPDSSARAVKITRSSRVADVDRQLIAGGRGWCVAPTKDGRTVDVVINIDF
jgi:hypothetical protein